MQINAESRCIEELCRNTVGCVGFNPKGHLKDRLLPYTNWTLSSKEEGISVLGKYFYINYINLLFSHQENSLGTFFLYRLGLLHQ